MAETLTLHFPDVVRVAGETLQGTVDVNIPMAMEDKVENVRIKLRGSIVTYARKTRRTIKPRWSMSLLRIDQQIWDHFNSQQGAQVLSCPFSIQLPPNLPPSFHYSHSARTVAVSYSIEVVGSRHGLFHANRRVRKIFSVVPAANGYELNATAALRQGWNGPWKPYVNSRELRHGILGDYSEAKMELTLPDLPSFPMFVGIPFSFHVMTRTKPVHHDDLDHKGQKLFPAPPESPADIELVLRLQGHMRAHGAKEELDQKFNLKGSLGDKASLANVRITTDQPVWTPLSDHKDKGTWTRGVRFDGLMSIPFTPTSSTATAEWHYMLRYDIDFPGLGNHLTLELPIHIHSGCAPSGPPPMLTLPAEYWSGKDHDWDEDS
ncbi:hypothetical protein B0H12DRAFT_1009112 [Mycena haematopus]|nr:hypothetical protein B0H12DRAFT_1009112 [Mycena haematopus]